MNREERDRVAFGSYNIHGRPDLESENFRFWLNPSPLVYIGGRGLCAFAFENDPRHRSELSSDFILDTLKRLMAWYKLPFITFTCNRERTLEYLARSYKVKVQLRFQCTGYADLYEIRKD